ncbi:MAG: ROK family protein [Deltaproteobacteria bacterium]|nr:ROK family protein [Deltaproteobacteria bacterium]MBW2362715.1 ROK family protein [Deltaproteobacteria bacterium]
MSEVYASVDLGGSKVACALATGDGNVLAERTIPTQSHQGSQAVFARIAALVSELAAEAGCQPAALGMGVPGLVDLEAGVVEFLPNLPTQWRDVPARDMLSSQVGCPVHLLNDVRMATLGELVFGHGSRGACTMVFFALGTGIGGGVVVDGKLRLGPLGAAGELGHQTILPDGPRCGCGNRGCLETLAAGPAITAQGVWLLHSGRAPRLHELVGGDAAAVTPKEMAQAAEAGDEAVREALVRAAEYLGIGVANVVTALHPELVVLGGGVAEMGPLLLDVVRESVRRRVRMFPTEDVRIERSLLGDKAGLLGGIVLAMKGGSIGGRKPR